VPYGEGKEVEEVVDRSGGQRHRRAAPTRWSKAAVTWIGTEAMVERSRKSSGARK
jgi:hypothetical protein